MLHNNNTAKKESSNISLKKTNDVSKSKERILFEYPPLPFWETVYYFVVTFSAVVYAWYRIYQASERYLWDGGWGIYEYGNVPFFGRRRQDVTNYEWRMYLPYLSKMLPWMIGHAFLFNISEEFLSHAKWKMFMLIYWLTACYIVYQYQLMIMTLICGITTYTVMKYTKNKLAIWIVSMTMLYLTLNNQAHVPKPINYYSTVAFLAYKLLQYISFCVEECDNGRPENKNFFKGLYNMFWYSFYLPYLNALIVIYRNFPPQIEQRRTRPRNWRKTLFYGLRIIFWYYFIEFCLYFFYISALLGDPEHMYTISEDTLVTLGYAAGTFFYMKYVIIFGLPTFFAKLDNMQPLDGPICINRVTLYSKIWRNFDRGLYQFFKEYIFIPICRPTFSIPRKIVGVFVSYGFVLVWHGFQRQYIIWIILNIVEIFMEVTVKSLYTIQAVRKWRESHLSDRNFRRILAFLHLCPFAFGLYAIFYFLTDEEAGYVFVDRIFWQETVTLKYPFFLLLFLGYHFCHVVIDIDRWMDARRANIMKKLTE